MFPYYYFLIATVFAVLPISFIAKGAIDQVKVDPGNQQKIMQSFYLKVFIAEIIPIVLVILGFINQEPAQSMNDLIGPGILNLVFILFGNIFIIMQRAIGTPEESKNSVTFQTLISLSLVNSIPIISIVAFFLMLPQ